ncbi:MAG: redoxin domain-containing protein [Planctomycetota bacterium]
MNRSPAMPARLLLPAAACFGAAALGCGDSPKDNYAAAAEAIAENQQARAAKKQMLMEQGYSAEDIQRVLDAEFGDGGIAFNDDAVSNADPPARIADLVFVKPSKAIAGGEPVRFADLLGKQKIVLVVTRGYSGGMICPFCTAQTAQLAAKHDEFVELGAEVLIVYPGSREQLPDFLAAATGAEAADLADLRWPVLLDPDLSAVGLLDIAADLASPSTFIFNSRGDVAFAYVGASPSDRPSVGVLLDQLKQID